MKYLCTLLALIASPFLLFSQVHPDGDPVETSFSDFTIPSSYSPRNELFEVECGDDIEGDYIGEMCFTYNGNLVLVPHRTTNNVSVIDWASQEVIADIPVGISPMQVKANALNKAVVACLGSNDAYVIDLNDYSIEAIIPVGTDPISVRLNQSGTFAAIGNDASNDIVIIDLSTLSAVATVPNVDIGLSDFSFITSNPRNAVAASDFVVTDAPPYLIYPMGDDALGVVDLTSGNPIDTLTGVGNVNYMRLSPNAQFLVTMEEGTEGQFTRIDPATLEILQTYSMPMDMSAVGGFGDRFGMNNDGTKVYTGIGGNEAAIINLATSDIKVLQNIGSPDWVSNTADGRYAISGDFFFSIIDFETDDVVETIQGIPHLTGAVSPIGPQIISAHPIRFEGVYYYDIDLNTEDLQFLGSSATGSALEADASYSVHITPDQTKAVVVNNLSRSLSIIDLATKSLSSIIPLGDSEVFFGTITPDSKYALVSRRLLDDFVSVNLETGEIVAETSSNGGRPSSIVIKDDTECYVANAASGDRLARFSLTNGVPTLESGISNPWNVGVSWTNYGIYSDVTLTQDQTKLVTASSFTDELVVLDVNTLQVLQTIPTGAFPLQIEWSDDGQILLLTLKNQDAVQLGFYDGNTVALIDPIDVAENLTRAAFNPIDSTFAVCSNNENRIAYINAEEGMVEGFQNFGDYTPLAVDYGVNLEEWVLLRAPSGSNLPHQLQVGSTRFDLPALPIHHYGQSDDGSILAIPHPGTDQLSIFEFTPLGTQQSEISLRPENLYQIGPNPVQDIIHFQRKEPVQSLVNCTVFTQQGTIVRQLKQVPGEGFSINVKDIPAGIYTYVVQENGKLVGSGKFVVQ